MAFLHRKVMGKVGVGGRDRAGGRDRGRAGLDPDPVPVEPSTPMTAVVVQASSLATSLPPASRFLPPRTV